MNVETYLEASKRTDISLSGYIGVIGRISDESSVKLAHAILGLTSEIPEVMEAERLLEKDFTNFLEEIGDMYWYTSLGISAVTLRDSSLKQFSDQPSLFSATDSEKVSGDYWANKTQIVLLLNRVYANIGTLADLYKGFVMYGKKFPGKNILLELLEIVRKLDIICSLSGSSAEEVMAKNIAKLKARYPQKFTEKLATNRDLENEKRALEE